MHKTLVLSGTRSGLETSFRSNSPPTALDRYLESFLGSVLEGDCSDSQLQALWTHRLVPRVLSTCSSKTILVHRCQPRISLIPVEVFRYGYHYSVHNLYDIGLFKVLGMLGEKLLDKWSLHQINKIKSFNIR